MSLPAASLLAAGRPPSRRSSAQPSASTRGGAPYEEGGGVNGSGRGHDGEARRHPRHRVRGEQSRPHLRHRKTHGEGKGTIRAGGQPDRGSGRGGEQAEQQQGADRLRGLGGTDVDEPRRLTLTWTGPGEDRPHGESRVTFEPQPYGDTTRLTVTHVNLREDDKEYRSISGSWNFVPANLKTYVETGTTLPVPARRP
ncbi:SRPBCC domain-containing protein [Streptomyces nondiastaticus]|uniref:SRPBCC domain-containing protein n=1 Tax=Streptomyces nondiastaticus TaxID=3154512 RepID=UPI00342B89A1